MKKIYIELLKTIGLLLVAALALYGIIHYIILA